MVILIAPPEKSPGRSGVDDLKINKLSINELGIISKEKALLSGSVLGKIELFNKAVLYLSFKPLTITNLLSWTDAPETLFKTSPIFLSGDFLMVSEEIPSEIEELFFCMAKIEAAVSFLEELFTTTSANCLFFALNKPISMEEFLSEVISEISLVV